MTWLPSSLKLMPSDRTWMQWNTFLWNTTSSSCVSIDIFPPSDAKWIMAATGFRAVTFVSLLLSLCDFTNAGAPWLKLHFSWTIHGWKVMVQDGLFVSSVKWHLHFVRFQCLSSVLRVCIFCALCHDIHELSAILNFFSLLILHRALWRTARLPFKSSFHHSMVWAIMGSFSFCSDTVFFVFDVIFLRDHRPLFREAGCLLNR